MNETAAHAVRKRHKLPVWLMIVQDVLLLGVILCTYALFHHVIPYAKAASVEHAPVAVVERPEETPAPEAEAEEDTRTPWQKKFAEHFTDEVVITDHSYTSPEVSVNISTVQTVLDGYNQVWYVTDIYIAQIENFQTYAPENSFARMTRLPIDQIAQESNAVVCINGDYCNAQVQYGFYVRNGEVFQTDHTICDICVLYYDGTMETLSADDYDVDEVLAKSPYQVWKFGPRLLDDNGQPFDAYYISDAIAIGNPRSAIGYYEPGHYCFVTCDGRHQTEWSRGLTINQLAQLFADLGCTAAYNLDGGASATLAFNGALFNRQSSERDIGDVLLIKEIDRAEDAQ